MYYMIWNGLDDDGFSAAAGAFANAICKCCCPSSKSPFHQSSHIQWHSVLLYSSRVNEVLLVALQDDGRPIRSEGLKVTFSFLLS